MSGAGQTNRHAVPDEEKVAEDSSRMPGVY